MLSAVRTPAVADVSVRGTVSQNDRPEQVLPVRPILSAREVEVLTTWLRLGSKDAAARELYISPATVSTHIVRIRAKYTAVGRPAPTKSALFARLVQDGHTTIDEW